MHFLLVFIPVLVKPIFGQVRTTKKPLKQGLKRSYCSLKECKAPTTGFEPVTK
jgi:hypothetical protein